MSVTALPRAEDPGVRRYAPRTRLSAGAAALVNRLSRPRAPLAGTVEGLPLRLTLAGVALDAPPEWPDAVAITLRLDAAGSLDLTLPAAVLDRLARAVQADLGAPFPSAPAGPLLLELALAPLLEAAERLTARRVQVERIGKAGPRPHGMMLRLDGTLAGEAFPLRLDLGSLPSEAAPPLAAILALVEALPVRMPAVETLPLVLAFVAGHTRLTLGQARSLRVGDAILPDLWHPASGEILVAVGDALSAKATADRHTSRLKTPFGPAAQGSAADRDGEMTRETAAGAAASERLDEASLDTVEVGLRFELGRRSLSVGELRSVGAGHVFDLGLDPEAPVDLVVNGARIGCGEIVEVGERVGVRVVRLFGQD